MKNQRRRTDLQKEDHGGSNSGLLITDLPYQILVVILSLLPIKDAVVTSSVCKTWKNLWCGLTELNFDASESFSMINKGKSHFPLERSKYILQVYSVIRSFNHPVVHRFRINFDLRLLNQSYFNDWLQFAVNKKVEILELDIDNAKKVRHFSGNYEFPLTLPVRKKGKYISDMVVELRSLKKLYLNNVLVSDAVLEELVSRSPHIESISIHGSRCLTRIRFGGRHLNLKHFEIRDCFNLHSIHLSDIDLVSFTYMGPSIDLCFSNVPKLKEVNIYRGTWKVESFVFTHFSSCVSLLTKISSCVSPLQPLSFTLHLPMNTPIGLSVPQLPNVKNLTLITGAHEDDSLLWFTSITNSCPNLETFIIQLEWFSPIRRRRMAGNMTFSYRLGNLKVFKILGYYGRLSDLELATYVLDHAVELKTLVIDPRCQNPDVITTKKELLKKERAARSFAMRQLKSLVPMKAPAATLVIL